MKLYLDYTHAKTTQTQTFVVVILNCIFHKHTVMIQTWCMVVIKPIHYWKRWAMCVFVLCLSDDNKTTVTARVNIYAVDFKGQSYVACSFFPPSGRRTNFRCERATQVKWDLKRWAVGCKHLRSLRGKTNTLFNMHFLFKALLNRLANVKLLWCLTHALHLTVLYLCSTRSDHVSDCVVFLQVLFLIPCIVSEHLLKLLRWQVNGSPTLTKIVFLKNMTNFKVVTSLSRDQHIIGLSAWSVRAL